MQKQYSLKSLMLGITVLSVLIVVPRQRSLRQQYAHRYMGAEIGGYTRISKQTRLSRLIFGRDDCEMVDTLSFAGGMPSKVDRDLRTLFPSLSGIHVRDCPTIGTGLERIAETGSRIRYVTIVRSGLTTVGFDGIGSMHELSWLSISESTLAGIDLRALKRLPELKHLHLTRTRLDPSQLTAIAACRHIVELNLRATNITDQDVALLSTMRPLRRLDLTDCAINGEGLAALTDMPLLEALVLDNCPLSDDSLRHVERLSNLKFLRIRGTQVSPDAIERLRLALPQCEIESHAARPTQP